MHTFQNLVEAEKHRLLALAKPKVPSSLAEALRLAADLVEKNEKLEKKLSELIDQEYPEVLRNHHIMRLMEISRPTLFEWQQDPTYPFLNKNRKKGDAVLTLKADLYEWLKTRSVVV